MDKGSVQAGDTVSETELVDDEAIYYVSGLALVDFHCTWEYAPNVMVAKLQSMERDLTGFFLRGRRCPTTRRAAFRIKDRRSLGD